MALYRTPQLTFSLDEAQDFSAALAAKLGLCPQDIRDWSFARKSLDVRHKCPRFQAVIDVEVSAEAGAALQKRGLMPPQIPAALPQFRALSSRPRVAILGAGPAGLFAAMTLAEAGLRPDIFDRGKPVEDRARDVAAMMRGTSFDPESNICFGEGGAGTYSDGKLMTRTKPIYIPHILTRLIALGADPNIAYESHPHVGTDRLSPILKALRQWLTERGTRYHFSQRIESLWIEHGACKGIVVGGQKLAYDAVFLCVGHSADDVFEDLHAQGVALAPKPLAIGVRIEHPQALIDAIQYGRFAGHPLLPPAEYAVRFNHDTLPSAFSFCMCPGGRVVNSQTTPDTRVVNGMSSSSRSGRHANAALVVQAGEQDFEPGPLGGLRFVRKLERRAAQNCPPAFAPAQNLVDFINKRPTTQTLKTTYAPGTVGSDIHRILPPNLSQTLLTALRTFDQQMYGFITREANLIALESRTSSPVRILRTPNYISQNTQNLYPLGEGSGYAGGITSCAIDGLQGALAFLKTIDGW
ncbi:MAG: hypothetical protein FWC40_00895 [Proteobacteria bacterium]|nr:hypothetical protein [Pseudomonadota bacterium]